MNILFMKKKGSRLSEMEVLNLTVIIPGMKKESKLGYLGGIINNYSLYINIIKKNYYPIKV